jgi:PAS domain S-box-containing protein/putative nucleotidyltransferase with HDIG domain
MQGPTDTTAPRLSPPASRAGALLGVFLLMLLGSSAYEVFKTLLLPPLSFWQSHAITFISGSALATVIADRVLRGSERQEAARRRTEAGLREREQQYRMVFENATHGIYRTTPDGRILLANPALLQMLGFETFEDLATRNLETEGTEADYTREEFRRLIETEGRVRGLEAVWIRKDGRRIFVRENAQLVRGPDGEPLFYEGSAEDVTRLVTIQEALQRSHEELENRVADRTREVIALNAELTGAYDATIEGWSRALDLRDKETEGHCRRVMEMTLRLARALKLPDSDLVQVQRGALLHDIGKMGVPDAILLKPGPLTDDEWRIMRRHPTLAYEMLSPIAFLRPALAIPHFHHEKWDGTGYPNGLAGEAIPLAARLFAIVDVWDALLSDRPYRPGWPVERVRAHIEAGSGSHFDPQVVAAFLALTEETPLAALSAPANAPLRRAA